MDKWTIYGKIHLTPTKIITPLGSTLFKLIAVSDDFGYVPCIAESPSSFLENLSMGDSVKISGFLKETEFIDGNDKRTMYEIKVTEIKKG